MSESKDNVSKLGDVENLEKTGQYDIDDSRIKKLETVIVR